MWPFKRKPPVNADDYLRGYRAVRIAEKRLQAATVEYEQARLAYDRALEAGFSEFASRHPYAARIWVI